jgi:predicted NUDIX family phosphoesterase
MKRTAKDPAASREEASREAARRELEEARRIAERTPQTIVYTGLGPYKIDKSNK